MVLSPSFFNRVKIYMKYNHSILKNGLRVISVQIQDSQVANISIWFKAGYGYETDNECGYTHLFEHLLFCGTKRRPDNYAVNIEKDKIGAYSNAFTFKDQLYFLIQSGSNYMDQMFDLLSDMILNSSIKEDVVENEKMIVTQELRKIQGDRMASSDRIQMENFFNGHPLAKNILLSGETIKKASYKELKDFYRFFCIPTRAAVVVSGNSSHVEVVALCEKYFGSWNSGEGSEFKTDIYKPIINRKQHFFKEDLGPQTILAVNFYTPGIDSAKENAALNLVANYLGYGFTGLLYRELRIKKGLVYNLNSSNWPYENIGIFNISTQTEKPQEAFDIINEKINELPLSFDKESLETLKIQCINSFIRKISDPMEVMKFMGRGFVINNPMRSPDEYIKSIQSVTYEDIIGVIKKYLVSSNRFIFVQGPKDIKF